MKILISAYACAPNHGSEHGIGWNWATEATRLGHDVWALVSSAHRNSISDSCGNNPEFSRLRWVFPVVYGWPLRQATEPKWERTYNTLWQLSALRHARLLHQQINFDLIHHLTWGGVRAPTFLGAVGAPLIVGPTGGGETAPAALRAGFHARGKIVEKIRDFSNATITLNPLVRPGLTAASAIFIKTEETRYILNERMQRKAHKFSELTLRDQDIGAPRSHLRRPPRLLYAGRLLYWKGVHIAIQAFAQILHHCPDANLTIVGNGPEEARLKSDAVRLGLENNITFIPRLPQNEFFSLYDTHDIFIFPSLHDSSGGVVVEALSRGMAVVCLDLGGPAVIANNDCASIVTTTGRTTQEVAKKMADSVCRIINSEDEFCRLSANAVRRAKDFILTERVSAFYDQAARMISDAAQSFHAKTVSRADVITSS